MSDSNRSDRQIRHRRCSWGRCQSPLMTKRRACICSIRPPWAHEAYEDHTQPNIQEAFIRIADHKAFAQSQPTAQVPESSVLKATMKTMNGVRRLQRTVISFNGEREAARTEPPPPSPSQKHVLQPSLTLDLQPVEDVRGHSIHLQLTRALLLHLLQHQGAGAESGRAVNKLGPAGRNGESRPPRATLTREWHPPPSGQRCPLVWSLTAWRYRGSSNGGQGSSCQPTVRPGGLTSPSLRRNDIDNDAGYCHRRGLAVQPSDI